MSGIDKISSHTKNTSSVAGEGHKGMSVLLSWVGEADVSAETLATVRNALGSGRLPGLDYTVRSWHKSESLS